MMRLVGHRYRSINVHSLLLQTTMDYVMKCVSNDKGSPTEDRYKKINFTSLVIDIPQL